VEVLNLKGVEDRWKSIGLKLNVDDSTNDGFQCSQSQMVPSLPLRMSAL
jgi:hypothetical protein